MPNDRAYLDRLTWELIDNGKLIEAGWIGLQLSAIPDNASKVQLDEMRAAFFAGAQHLFSSIVAVLEPGVSPTSNDLLRLSKIARELDAFIADFSAKNLPTKGSA